MCEFCSDTLFVFSKKEQIQLAKDLKIGDVVGDAINQLHEGGKVDKATKKALWAGHNAPLQKAVVEGYGKPLSKIEYGTPNYEFLKQLQTNTAVFAMFKSHASMKDMAALLKDADGNLRSKYDFKKEALKVDDTYRTTKLDVEYDTAVRQARMASQWAKFQKNKHLYPNLKYLLTKAAKPDEKHLQFVGIIRPVDDAFWNAHYPPNRWRCQCSVEQTDEDAGDIPDNIPPVPAEFAFNSGKTGQIFDIEKCNYYNVVSPKEQVSLIKKAKDYMNTDIAAQLPYQTLYASNNGATVDVHPLTFNEPDLNNLIRNARSLANIGKNIKMLPAVKDVTLRAALLPKDIVKNIRTPDFVIDGKMNADLKVMAGTSKRTLKHQFDDLKGQTNNLLIEAADDFPFTKYQTIKMVKEKMRQKEMKGFGEVWINYKGNWIFNPHKKRD